MTAKKVVKRNGDRSKRVQSRLRQCVCEWCGVSFFAARYHATTCSDAHRLKWSRWRKRYLRVNGYECAAGPHGDPDRQQTARAPS